MILGKVRTTLEIGPYGRILTVSAPAAQALASLERSFLAAKFKKRSQGDETPLKLSNGSKVINSCTDEFAILLLPIFVPIILAKGINRTLRAFDVYVDAISTSASASQLQVIARRSDSTLRVRRYFDTILDRAVADLQHAGYTVTSEPFIDPLAKKRRPHPHATQKARPHFRGKRASLIAKAID